MRFKKEIKDRLYGGYLGVVTDKLDFEIIKVMLADDKKKVEGLEWPFGAVTAVIAVAPNGSVVALKEELAESYELVKYQDAVEEDMQPIDADVNEVAEMPDLSIIGVTPSKVEGNAEQFKLAIKSYLKRYDDIVVTADNYKELSDTVSKLKKEMNDVNDKKKKVKKKAMEGYTLFENEMKEVLKMFESSIKTLSDEIKQFTDKEVEENKKVVESLCNRAVHDYVERNDFNEYFASNFFNADPRWSTLKKFINNHKPTKALVDEIKQECERVKKEYEIYQQKIEGLCIYLEAKCKESGIDQQMFDLDLYKKMLVQESLESLTRDIDCRINRILRNRELKKQKEEVQQQEKTVNTSPEENEPQKMLLAKIMGTDSALEELKTALESIKAKYGDGFKYAVKIAKKKEGK